MSDNTLLKVCDLWERQTRKRQPYIVGAMGGLKVLLFRRHDAGEDGPHWSLFVAERKPAQRTAERRQAATPTPAATPPPEPAVPSYGSAVDQRQRTAELAEAFDRRGPDDLEDLF